MSVKGEPHEYVVCRECGSRFKTIEHSHLVHKHGMTIEEYEEKYPDAERVSTSTLAAMNNREGEFWKRVGDIFGH